jgi:hypothetical protein
MFSGVECVSKYANTEKVGEESEPPAAAVAPRRFLPN